MTNSPLASRQLEFDDASEAVEHYITQGWTDGLPIVPPTEARVREMLEYAELSPSEIVGAEPTKGRIITAEKVAINAVMAGCLPEYFPVVTAAIEAMSEPQFNFHAATVSTMGAAVLTVVNGPITETLGMNSGISVFGPGNRANATIGRAIRLIVTNASGAAPGVLDRSTQGHPGKYSFCIAEAEAASPWEPLHVERGFFDDQSAVTVFAGLSPIQATGMEADSPETFLTGLADVMMAVGHGQTEIVVVMSPGALNAIRTARWTKDRTKDYICLKAERTVSEWVNAARLPANGGEHKSMEALLGVANSPDGITIVVAGGVAGGACAVIPLWGGGATSRSVTREVMLPPGAS